MGVFTLEHSGSSISTAIQRTGTSAFASGRKPTELNPINEPVNANALMTPTQPPGLKIQRIAVPLEPKLPNALFLGYVPSAVISCALTLIINSALTQKTDDSINSELRINSLL